jgi:hypothetical protein
MYVVAENIFRSFVSRCNLVERWRKFAGVVAGWQLVRASRPRDSDDEGPTRHDHLGTYPRKSCSVRHHGRGSGHFGVQAALKERNTMRHWFRFMTVLSLVLGSVAFAACGDDGGDDGGDGDGEDDGDGSASTSSSSSESYTCCLNGSFYECPSSSALSECSLNTGPGDCDRNSSRDDECNN